MKVRLIKLKAPRATGRATKFLVRGDSARYRY